MQRFTLIASVLALVACVDWSALAAEPTTKPAADALSFVVKDIHGNDYDLSQHRGQVVLFVNVASKCGFTKQYAGLEQLYRKYKDQGLVVVGFPANDFKGQEPGTNEEILAFCTGTYDVTFPMMSKISVKGDDKHPVYQYLTEKPTAGEHAGEVGWNFTKFLVDREGKVIGNFPSKVAPDDAQLVGAIEQALGSK